MGNTIERQTFQEIGSWKHLSTSEGAAAVVRSHVKKKYHFPNIYNWRKNAILISFESCTYFDIARIPIAMELSDWGKQLINDILLKFF